MRVFFKTLSCLLAVFCSLIFTVIIVSSASLLDNYNITASTDNETNRLKINGIIPASFSAIDEVSAKEAYIATSNTTSKKQETGYLKDSNQEKEFSADVMLMNCIPIKKVNVTKVSEQMLVPSGELFGVKFYTDGVIVVDISDVKSSKGLVCPAKDAEIKKGDIILSVDDKKITCDENFAKCVTEAEGKELKLEVKRDGKIYSAYVKPEKDIYDNRSKLGIWVRDSSAGVGTLTFYNPKTKAFAGLGHGICDADTGNIMPFSHGDISKAKINGITKGIKGAPGEIKGSFDMFSKFGDIRSNKETGIYGVLHELNEKQIPVSVAMKQEVSCGKAMVLTTVNGVTPKFYEATIESINYNKDLPTKNMTIKITDKQLLDETGGIVQGMSGSPILQNGKIVGAITHVFVNNPERGYAIFVENMLGDLEETVCKTEVVDLSNAA